MSNALFNSALTVLICFCFIAYPYIAKLIKISSNNRKIRKLKEEKRELERELEEEIKKGKKILEILEILEKYKN